MPHLSTRWRCSSEDHSWWHPLSPGHSQLWTDSELVWAGNSGSQKKNKKSLLAAVTHLMRQKKDFSCMHSVGDDSERDTGGKCDEYIIKRFNLTTSDLFSSVQCIWEMCLSSSRKNDIYISGSNGFELLWATEQVLCKNIVPFHLWELSCHCFDITEINS